MFRTVLPIIIFSLCLLSCDVKDQVVIKNEKGEIQEQYLINEAKQKHGLYQSFINGVKIEEANYQNDKLNGKRTLFHTNGSIEIEEQYVNNVMVGPYKAYYHTGVLSQEANYKEGMMQGLLKTYYNSGELKEEVTMVDNQENGPFKEYFKNGKIKWKGQFLNGDNEFGLLEEFNEEGELIKKLLCDSLARCSTIWTLENGEIEK